MAEPLSRCLEFRSSSEHHLTWLMLIRDHVPLPAAQPCKTLPSPLSPPRPGPLRGFIPRSRPRLPHLSACPCRSMEKQLTRTGCRNWTSCVPLTGRGYGCSCWGCSAEEELRVRTQGSWDRKAKRPGGEGIRGRGGKIKPVSEFFLELHPGSSPQKKRGTGVKT